MPPDPRIQDLLERYPDQLTEQELAELRAAAERDPEVDELLDAIHQVEGVLSGVPPVELSELGQARLDRLVEEAKNWSTGGSTPESKVVDLGAVRRRRSWLTAHPAATALAAVMVVAAGFMIRDQLTPPTEFVWRGDDDSSDPDRIEGELYVMGETRLEDGDPRAVDRPITFRAVLEEPAALVLVETQAGRSFVLWPEPGEEWQASVGSNLLQPSGLAATYAPAGPGEATYTLLATHPEAPIPVPPERQTPSPAALVEGMEGTWVLGRITILWEAAR